MMNTVEMRIRTLQLLEKMEDAEKKGASYVKKVENGYSYVTEKGEELFTVTMRKAN